MNHPEAQRLGPQAVQSAAQTAGRKRRIRQIMPDLRDRIPGLFDADVLAERLAETFSVSKTEILEDMIRDTRRMVMGRARPSGLRIVQRVA
jgi:hypothetical protein